MSSYGHGLCTLSLSVLNVVSLADRFTLKRVLISNVVINEEVCVDLKTSISQLNN